MEKKNKNIKIKYIFNPQWIINIKVIIIAFNIAFNTLRIKVILFLNLYIFQ